MKANSDKSKQSNKATRRVLAGVLCGASVLSLVLSLVMPPISQAIANDAQTVSAEETVMGGGSSSESTDVGNTTGGDAENQNSDDAENGASEDSVAADSTADDAEAEDAVQPSDAQSADDEKNDENTIAPASVSADGYTEVSGDVAERFANGGKFRLTDSAFLDKKIAITANTTIDLAGHMLYCSSGNLDSFFVVKNGATLTIEDSGQTIDAPSPVDTANTPAGQLASMEWERGSGPNNGTPKILTYYETKSAPNPDGLGTTETTTKHVVTSFGAIDAAPYSGSVKHVVYVEDGGTLDLKGGMITTAASLSNDGHVIFSEGTVNIEGGYVTNGNGGGWGGGLCITGTKASLEMTGGVIAGNKAGSGGGIYADKGANLNLAGGIISGNATYANTCNDGGNPSNGYGGGVFTNNAVVGISGSANITNNCVDSNITESYNNGLLGGGGIASVNGGTLTMTGGSVTANYSHEAGGGVYAGFYNQSISFKMTGGTIAGNMAENAEGGGLRVAGGDSVGTNAKIDAAGPGKVFITNNKTMTGSTQGRGGDWGGGGIFIQKGGKLNIVRTLITQNEAGGWGGGIGACPTGETIVSHSNGAAIYNNTDHGDGNHMSAGGNGKDEDSNPDYITDTFKNAGHKDFFLVRKKGSDKTVAVVLGKMLGNGSAGWKGTCDGQEITIDPNGGAEAKYMFGLEANPTDEAVEKAQAAATTIISGNYSYTHGGGIMTNGDLTVGEVTSLDVYPAIKVKANKVLMKDGKPQGLTGHGYKFKLLGKAADSAGEPYWNTDGSLNANGCEATSEVTVNESGEIVIDTAANYQSGNYDLYLVEVPINEEGTTFDKAIYKIHIKVGTTPVNTTNLLGININRYEVDKSASTVSVKREGETGFTECKSPEFYNWSVDPKDNTISTVKIGNSSKPAFTNELAPYQTSGTWTPQVTKKVDGGEMKKFKFELYTMDGSEKTVLDTKSTADDSNNLQTVTFAEQKIGPLKVSDFNDDKATFTYYICECAADAGEGTSHKGYTNDTKTFKVVVTATDDGEGHLTCTPAYYEVDASGNANSTPTDTPTFTNTYSTSLPLSGMSGVTLTYLAGAAVLCAAAAWMHIRRKANAKGGERRE